MAAHGCSRRNSRWAVELRGVRRVVGALGVCLVARLAPGELTAVPRLAATVRTPVSARIRRCRCDRLSFEKTLERQPSRPEKFAAQSSRVSLIRAVITLGSSSIAKAAVHSNPRGPVIRTLKPPRNGSAAIHASCGAVNCRPAATDAASMGSRLVAGIPFVSKTVIGTRQFYSTAAIGSAGLAGRHAG